jgi:hypothetical protein
MANSKDRFWQTLIRIVKREDNVVHIAIPACTLVSNETIELRIGVFPKEYHNILVPRKRFLAQVNIGAESKEELIFKNITFRG